MFGAKSFEERDGKQILRINIIAKKLARLSYPTEVLAISLWKGEGCGPKNDDFTRLGNLITRHRAGSNRLGKSESDFWPFFRYPSLEYILQLSFSLLTLAAL